MCVHLCVCVRESVCVCSFRLLIAEQPRSCFSAFLHVLSADTWARIPSASDSTLPTPTSRPQSLPSTLHVVTTTTTFEPWPRPFSFSYVPTCVCACVRVCVCVYLLTQQHMEECGPPLHFSASLSATLSTVLGCRGEGGRVSRTHTYRRLHGYSADKNRLSRALSPESSWPHPAPRSLPASIPPWHPNLEEPPQREQRRQAVRTQSEAVQVRVHVSLPIFC